MSLTAFSEFCEAFFSIQLSNLNVGWGIPKFLLVAEVGVALGISELCTATFVFKSNLTISHFLICKTQVTIYRIILMYILM